MSDPANPTVRNTVNEVRIACRTTNYTQCTTNMAGYLHGLMNKVALVDKRYHYAILEVILGCEIYSYSQLTYHTCKTLIDLMQSENKIPAMCWTIMDSIRGRVPADHVFCPGEFKNYLMVCGEETVYAF